MNIVSYTQIYIYNYSVFSHFLWLPYLCSMKTVIDLSIPKSWQELPDKEMRFVFRLLNGSYTLTQVKVRCLLRWAGMKVARQEGALTFFTT